MISPSELNRQYPTISSEDEAWWLKLAEMPSEFPTTSELYRHIDLKGKQAAVVGPWYLPNDIVALQLAYSLGPDGMLYSVDPQGDSGTPRSNSGDHIIGLGSSTKYQEQLRRLRSYGFPLSEFVWLGPNSSIENILLPPASMDCIADHGTLEFLSKFIPLPARRRGVEAIIDKLRVGGIWVHHTNAENFLEVCRDTFPSDEPIASWIEGLGIRMQNYQVQLDRYRFPVSDVTVQNFIDAGDSDDTLIISSNARKHFMVEDGSIVFPEALTENSHHYVYVVQKIAS